MINKEKHQNYVHLPLSLGDPVYDLYLTETQVIRKCNNDHKLHVKELWQSGLLQELFRRELIPQTIINDPLNSHETLIIIQERIKPVIYPFEWSPEMLRKAAVCIIKVNQCANEFGYQLKDAHPYNIVFKYSTPLFVDVGSFIKTDIIGFWSAYSEFKVSFMQTLQLAHCGCLSIFKRSFLISGTGYEPHELFILKYPLLSRLIGIRFLKLLFQCKSIYQIGPTIEDRQIKTRFKSKPLYLIANFLLKSTWLPFRTFNTRRLLKKISAYKLQHHSDWGDYHERSGYCTSGEICFLSERMLKAIDFVKELAPETVIDLAGNQGVLSRTIASSCPSVKSVLCSDYDPTAIDLLVKSLQPDEHVYISCFDFISEATDNICQERANRLKSDLVIALAVVHHLVLTQGIKLEVVFRTLYHYSNKYVVVEFMPMGLWDGNYAPPLPDWYNETWFTNVMQQYFEITKREQLEPNRIVFIGHKRNHSDSHLDF
jgi:hypothetical protein